MENTFEREVEFLSKVFVPDDGTGSWEEKPVKKLITFKELKQTDRDQHKLHFFIIEVFNNFGVKKVDDDFELKIEGEGIYDMTVKAIKTLAVVNENFTSQDKEEFLNDSKAIFTFGFWLLGAKLAPFFSKFS